MSKIIIILAAALTLYYRYANAEFYIWYDEKGVKHVSNIPKNCITDEKTVALNCSPAAPSEAERQERAVENQLRADEAKLSDLKKEYESLLNKYRTTARRGGNEIDEFGNFEISPVTLFIIKQELGILSHDIDRMEERMIRERDGNVGRFLGERYMQRVNEEIEMVRLRAKMEQEQNEAIEKFERERSE